MVALLPTCNAFTTDGYIFPQWHAIRDLYNAHVREVLGPASGHASDGDARRRAAQAREMRSTEGTRYSTGSPGSLTGVVLGSGDVAQVHDQDYIHCSKKLINSSDSAVRSLRLGPDKQANLSSLSVVLQRHSPSVHNMRATDSDRSQDAMDFPSVQRLTCTKALTCIAGMCAEYPNLLGMHRYLTVVRMYLSVFMSNTMAHKDRAKACGYVLTYLRVWKRWIERSQGYSLRSDFITLEAFRDTVLSCQWYLLMANVFRDRFPGKDFPVDLSGSDAAEQLFSALGSMVQNKRVFTYLEAIQNVGNMNIIEILRASGRAVFSERNRRLERVWCMLNDEPTERLALPVTESKQELREAEMAGDELARKHLREDGMAPEQGNPGWWARPWEGEWGNVGSAVEDKEDDGGADGDGGADNDDDGNQSGSEGDDSSEGGDDSDDEEGDEGDDEGSGRAGAEAYAQGGTKHSHTVLVGGGAMSKATFMRNLQGGRTSKVSADRQMRVKAASAHSKEREARRFRPSRDQWMVGQYDEIAVAFDTKSGGRQASKHKSTGKAKRKHPGARPDTTIWLGKVMKIVRAGKRRVEYRHPVDVGDKAAVENITFDCRWYTEQSDGTYLYNVNRDVSNIVGGTEVICKVELAVDEKFPDRFTLPPAQAAVLEAFKQGANEFVPPAEDPDGTSGDSSSSEGTDEHVAHRDFS